MYNNFRIRSKKNNTLNNMANRITTMAANIAESCLKTINQIVINSCLVKDKNHSDISDEQKLSFCF
jgi:hypothetical protein